MNETSKPSCLRVLVFDDDEYIHKSSDELVRALPYPVELLHASTVTRAAEILNDRYVDVVLIDLVAPDGSLAGLEILRYLSYLRVSAKVVLMTHLDVDMNHANVMNAIATSRAPHIVRFIDKRKSSNFLFDATDDANQELVQSNLKLEGLVELSDLIDKRRGRYRDDTAVGLRTKHEVTIEVERLCRRLFVAQPYGERQTDVLVRFRPIRRLGLSAAVLVEADVRLGIRGVPSESSYECVLKVGPRAEIAEEAGRYLEFVQFGVRLEERVELLAHAVGDSLGAVVYSMAGGTQGSLQSLDTLMLEAPEAAVAVIDRLFSSRNWYGTPAEPHPIRHFFGESLRTDFPASFDSMLRPLEQSLEAIGGSTRLNKDQELELLDSHGYKIILPSRSFTGLGRVLRPSEWCLVHGDMHGGNVMVELSSTPDAPIGRVNLIDYRQAGPGPRCIDAAALECAVRSAHAVEIEAMFQDEPSGIAAAYSSYHKELALLSAQWSLGTTPGPARPGKVEAWQTTSHAIVRGAQHVLSKPPLQSSEYVLTCLLFGLRQLRYPLRRIARVRIAVWVGALYSVFRSLGEDK
jgi:FixJ family two-component response regulator